MGDGSLFIWNESMKTDKSNIISFHQKKEAI